jgi:hypothetical protein
MKALSRSPPLSPVCHNVNYQQAQAPSPAALWQVGSALFATFADLIGDDGIRAAMAEFYSSHAPGGFTTAQLEQHLFCEAGLPEARDLFHRYVYGNEGDPREVADDYCG